MSSFDAGMPGDQSDFLANVRGQVIDIYHIPTGQSIQFKAFVTSFSDKYESDWNSEDVYGRMDPIQTFKKTSRKISLEWEVVSASVAEAKTNLARCTDLFNMLYPTYDSAGAASASSITGGPLFRLRFTNLLQDVTAAPAAGTTATAEQAGLVGSMSGFTYEPDFDQGVFAEGVGTIYPQTIKLSCDYTVNHTHGLGWTPDKQKRQTGFPYGDGGELGSGPASAAAGTGTAPTPNDTATTPSTAADTADVEGG
tara:strand:- start:967 stop:1725 length:759 start_codon:yes stop_codon:yes gene_type:complete